MTEQQADDLAAERNATLVGDERSRAYRLRRSTARRARLKLQLTTGERAVPHDEVLAGKPVLAPALARETLEAVKEGPAQLNLHHVSERLGHARPAHHQAATRRCGPTKVDDVADVLDRRHQARPCRPQAARRRHRRPQSEPPWTRSPPYRARTTRAAWRTDRVAPTT